MNTDDKQQLKEAIINDLKTSTVENRVKIPLIENFVMGLSLFLLTITVLFFFMNYNNIPIRIDEEFSKNAQLVLSLATLLGITLLTVLNLIRFGKDEWNLLALAYKLGHNSRNDEVNQLKQIVNNKDYESIPDNTKLTQFQNSLNLLSQLYRTNTISRNNRPSGMSEKDYTSARNYLIKAQLIDPKNNKKFANFNQAAKQLKNLFQ